jgi:hypothetical protein
MRIGQPNWQQYWLENAYAQLWTQAGPDGVGVDMNNIVAGDE